VCALSDKQKTNGIFWTVKYLLSGAERISVKACRMTGNNPWLSFLLSAANDSTEPLADVPGASQFEK